MKEIITKTAQETKKIGRDLAAKIAKSKSKDNQALVIGLEGDLGSGKTTFIQGLAQGLGIKEPITSPTFVILKMIELKQGKWNYFYHIDCYRISNPEDLLNLDFKEIINQPSIVVIEWAERVKEILPQNARWIKFEYLSQNERKITL